jgi:hypothetical protein
MTRSRSRWGPTRRNLIASFRSLTQARKAMDALESRGFDEGAIRVEGAPTGGPRPTPGPVTVAVGSDDENKVERAEDAIRELHPIEVRRVNERGDPV